MLEECFTGLVILCAVQWIPTVSLVNLKKDPLQDSKVLLILDISKRYYRYTQVSCAEQEGRLPENKFWDHKIPLQQLNAKIPTGGIYKTICDKDKTLQTYQKKEILTRKVG